jgi:hypothetical protein
MSGSLALAASVLAVPAVAGEFQWGEWEGSFNSQISLGSSWRMSDRDARLVTPGNSPGFGLASTNTADDGNLNFDDGDVYSMIFKGVHDFELRKNDFGVFLRAKYWYDDELENGSRPHGNSANLYAPDAELAMGGYDSFAQGSGIELLDAFIYNTFYLGENDVPLDIRLGSQVVSWGESTFIQNSINSINPADVSAFRRPGAEIKEGLLPVPMVYASTNLTDALSLEAFYQLAWESTLIEGCGTYFSTADVAATGCNIVTLVGGLSDQINMAGGLFITRQADREPDDDGQYGIALRYFAEKLAGTEFGLYYMNYHSRAPYLSGVTSANVSLGAPPGTPFIPGNPLGGNPQYYVEFPEDIELFGFSFATNLKGFAISGEVSYRPDFPVQINTVELLQGAVGEAPWSTMLPRILAAGPGTAAAGYDRLPLTQVQVTLVRFFDQVLGASRLSLVGEVGADFVGDLPEQSVQRYGRSPNFGMGYFEPIPLPSPPLPPGQFITCEAGNALVGVAPPNTNASNCTTEGYVTDSSWGYRLRATLTYNDVFAGINLTPTIAWSHDVDGYAPAPNFEEGNKAFTFSLAAEYLNRFTGSIAYTSYSGGDYNMLSDRDFLSLSVAVSF